MDSRCGTHPGWQVHNKRREKPCEPCRVARNGYQRWRYAGYAEPAQPRAAPESKRAIGARYRAGDGFVELSRLFGRHPQTIKKIVVDQGIALRRHATRGRRTNARCLDSEQRGEMAARYRNGWSVRELARAYRVSYGTAHNALTSMGVRLRRQGSGT